MQTIPLVKDLTGRTHHGIVCRRTTGCSTYTKTNSSTKITRPRMIPLLLTASSFLNFAFYIYAIGFVVALGLEQVLKVRPLSPETTMNERNMFIVQTNRKYLWRQTWIVNINWFVCNLGLYFLSRNMQPVGDTFWQGM